MARTKKKVESKTSVKSPKEKARDTGHGLEVRINDLVIKVRGKTVREAVDAFVSSEEFPKGSKTNAVLILTHGKKTARLVLYPSRARRLMLTIGTKDVARDVLAAQLDRLLE